MPSRTTSTRSIPVFFSIWPSALGSTRYCENWQNLLHKFASGYPRSAQRSMSKISWAAPTDSDRVVPQDALDEVGWITKKFCVVARRDGCSQLFQRDSKR